MLQPTRSQSISNLCPIHAILGPMRFRPLFSVFIAGMAGFIAFLVLYEKARRDWQDVLWRGTLGPCLRLGAFGLPEDTATLLLAGDSRIRHGMMPSLLARETGWRVRNIAEQLNLGGDLATLVATLKTLDMQERQRIQGLVVGLSAHGLDDADIRTMTGIEFNRYTLYDQIRLFGQSPRLYLHHARTVLWPGQYRSVRKRFAIETGQSRSGIPHSCLQPFALNRQDSEGFGFLPLRPKRKPEPYPDTGASTMRFTQDPATKPVVFGIRYSQALRSLKQLDVLGIDFILLLPPLNPSYCERADPSPCEPEKQLGARIAADLPMMRGRTVDFARFPPANLRAAHYIDASHLDSSGAEILSLAFADTLLRRYK